MEYTMEVNPNISPATTRPLQEMIFRNASQVELSSPLSLNDEVLAGNTAHAGDIIPRPASSGISG